MNSESLFAHDYQSARAKLLGAAAKVGADKEGFELEGYAGHDGEPLLTDVIYLGDRNASRVLVVSSGVHGVEGLCGSACQYALLNERLYSRLPMGVAVLLVHAVNPYGFSHHRRWNENNVDVNRNFRDFSLPVPENTMYAEIHEALLSGRSKELGLQSHTDVLSKYIEGIGVDEFVSRVAFGQSSHPNGLFYTGREPSWSNRVFHEILCSYLPSATDVIFVDVHTGIGAHGEPTVLYMQGADDRLRQTKAAFDQVVHPLNGAAVGTILEGEIVCAFDSLVHRLQRFVPITLEFGTFPTGQLIDTLRDTQAIFMNADCHGSDEYTYAQRLLLDAYCPNNLVWKKMVAEGFMSTFSQIVSAFENP